MKQVNADIRNAIKIAGIHQYEVADTIEIGEATLIRWLRYELTDERKNQIENAIQKLSGKRK